MPSAAAERLGPYEIITPIGASGMGEVYKARDTRLDRIVAISSKTSRRPDLSKEDRAIVALNHPCICQIHDVGPIRFWSMWTARR
jgi:serine/threonine protein kinase